MKCASFDIGVKNFAFYVEEFNENEITSITYNTKLYNRDGTISEPISDAITNTCTNGNVVLLEVVDISHDGDVKLSPYIFANMTSVLDKYIDLWNECDVFIIEQQMLFGKLTNPTAVKLAQHCYSYFSIKYNTTKCIYEFPAFQKTQVLGARKIEYTTPKGTTRYKCQTKPQRKKWCITKAIDILNSRDDQITINVITNTKKKDDLCDVICQCQAWKILKYMYNTIK